MELAAEKIKTPKSVRVAALVLPPAGLLMLWGSGQVSLWTKLWGTVWICFYGLCYAAIIAAILIQIGVLQIEWRGGPIPTLTASKTLPDYDALEAHRAQFGSATELSSPARPPAPAYWTDFRGPNRDGHYREDRIRTNWPAGGLPLLWRQPAGGGYASFVVGDGLAFTIEQRRTNEAVAAYDLETGREIWQHAYFSLFEESLGGDGPRATPAYASGRVYSLGALGILKCLEAASGRVLWTTNILIDNDAKLPDYGLSASPLVVDNKVIVTPGGPAGESVAAYDWLTGAPVWKALDDSQAYSSPMLVTLAGQRQILIVSATRAVGLRVEDGGLLWEYPWVVRQGNRNIAQPVVLGADRIFLSAGYGTGCAAVEIVRSGAEFTARGLWQNRNLKNKFTSSVLWEGHLYGLDEDILVCLEAATGQRKWKDGRYGYGQLLLASGHLVILAGDGQLALVRATPDAHFELARFQAITGKTWNHPALAHGRLLVRNAAEMACYDLSP